MQDDTCSEMEFNKNEKKTFQEKQLNTEQTTKRYLFKADIL